MADSIREKIISHIYDTFSDYSSFVAIVSPTVFRGVQIFDPSVTPPPIITILPKPEDAERTQYGTVQNVMPVDISALLRLGSNNPSEFGEAALGELIGCTFSSLPADASDFYYQSGGIDNYPDEQHKNTITVGMSIFVVYETDIGDPYTLTT